LNQIKVAYKLRAEFYAYMRALRTAPEAIQAQEEPELLQAVWQVAMKIDVDPMSPGTALQGQLVFFNKENTDSAKLIREALGMKSSAEQAKELEAKLLGNVSSTTTERLPSEVSQDWQASYDDKSHTEELSKPQPLSGIEMYLQRNKEPK
jgi:hypothetical protein